MINFRYHNAVSIGLAIGFGLALCGPAAAQSATPAEMISSYRLQHGEGKVTIDPTLNRIAREQAAAMAARDVLDHSVLGPFSSRVAPYGPVPAAENIAYGHDNFPKTLAQWIESSGHRRNLLMHGASHVGVASAKSAATGRTYWAMVIAGERDRSRQAKGGPAKGADTDNCRIKLITLCL
jgi:uncharacterized protein YkwD